MKIRVTVVMTEESFVYNLPKDLKEMISFIWKMGAQGLDCCIEDESDDDG